MKLDLACELAGLAALVAAAFLISIPLGVASTGVALLVIGVFQEFR